MRDEIFFIVIITLLMTGLVFGIQLLHSIPDNFNGTFNGVIKSKSSETIGCGEEIFFVIDNKGEKIYLDKNIWGQINPPCNLKLNNTQILLQEQLVESK